MSMPSIATVATFLPAAQQRILADAFSFSRWLTLQCATATSESWTVLRARHGAGIQAVLRELPTHALVAMFNDMRQPAEITRDVRDALVLRYLNDPEVKARLTAMARSMALDAQREQQESLARHTSFFQRVGAAVASL